MRLARTILPYLAWAFIGLLVVQVFLAGIGIFGAGSFQTHVDVGYTISVVPVLLVIAAAVGRTGRLISMSAALLVLAIVQTVLPLLRADLPFIAALHPVNALALFWLTLTIARRATELARTPEAIGEVETAG